MRVKNWSLCAVVRIDDIIFVMPGMFARSTGCNIGLVTDDMSESD